MTKQLHAEVIHNVLAQVGQREWLAVVEQQANHHRTQEQQHDDQQVVS